MSRQVIIVPHTHWDREWYLPFQTFRMKLVGLLDGLLDQLDADPSYTHFMLDGQMAVVDDYLAIRPHEAQRIRRLATAGRLSVGPWYAQMDEFLVSAETMVRDLQRGLERASAFGGAMEVGYLPDMFGHIAQMPQILRQFGFSHAVVWRGVPASIDASAFWWEAPDGSSVRAEYLVTGYGNGANLPDDGKELVAMLHRFADQHRDLLVDGPILWMNGTDHQLPRPYLGRVVAEANAAQDELELHIGTLSEYLDAAPTEGLPRWRGELRSGARANLLMGVGSNRVDVKQAAAAAERALERLAEPLCALYLPASEWPTPFLDLAWLEMIRNSAHDTSCACSVDEVNLAALHRYGEARQIAEGLTERALDALGTSLAEPGSYIVNPTARPRRGPVELTLPGHDDLPGTQVLHRGGGLTRTTGLHRAAVAHLAGEAIDFMEDLRDVTVEMDDAGELSVVLDADADDPRPRYTGDAAERLAALAAEHPDAPARIGMLFPETQRLLAWVEDVPGYGWQRWEATEPSVEAVALVEGGDAGDGSLTMSNGLTTVVIDPTDGTFTLDGTTGLGRLVDDGDSGDTYNYNTPSSDQVVDTPDAVHLHVLERGPLRAVVVVERTYAWPEGALFGARHGSVEVTVTMTLELIAGSRRIGITVELDNRARDHRLRLWFPTPRPATSSTAECAFAVVERGLEAEGGPSEAALATFPSRRFVTAGGLTVLHDGLLEYELVDRIDGSAHAMALTLLRCTGIISQAPMTARPLPAGPLVPSPGAQMPGRQVLRCAVLSGDDPGEAYAEADDWLVPLRPIRSGGGGSRGASGCELEVSGAEVSAIHRVGGKLAVRVFNPTSEPTRAELTARRGWLVDLRHHPIEPFEGGFTLGPWQIATALVDGD